MYAPNALLVEGGAGGGRAYIQGSHGDWKTWKMVMEKSGNMKNWPKVMEFCGSVIKCYQFYPQFVLNLYFFLSPLRN